VLLPIAAPKAEPRTLTREQHEFHLAHFERLVESVWHSQKIVDSRLSFFFTAIFATLGGLGALARSDDGPRWENVGALSCAAAGALLALGLVTLRAIAFRIRATEGFLDQVELLRDALGEKTLARECAHLVARSRGRPIANEGVSAVVAITNSIMAGLLVLDVWCVATSGAPLVIEIACAMAAALAMAGGQWYWTRSMSRPLADRLLGPAHREADEQVLESVSAQ
jgi:hypothetical protein